MQHALRARTGRVRQGVGREKQDLGHMLLVGSAGRVLWNSGQFELGRSKGFG